MIAFYSVVSLVKLNSISLWLVYLLIILINWTKVDYVEEKWLNQDFYIMYIMLDGEIK